MTPPIASSFTTDECDKYLSTQEVMFGNMVKQIRCLYPEARIHVMTNLPDEQYPGLIYHHLDFPSNHVCKFLLYGLLDVPAMYVDVDIILVRPFRAEHLQTENNFNCYSVSLFENLQQMTSKPLPVKTDVIYNAGLMWIPKPSKKIVADLQKLHETYFSDDTYMTSRGKWPYVDEYALSLYIKMQGINMNIIPEVNMPRHRITECLVPQSNKYQSIHYTGIRSKGLIEKEYNLSKCPGL